MDEARIAEIEELYNHHGDYESTMMLVKDIPDLLAEVKRLRGLLARVLEEGQIAFDFRLEIEEARK